MSWLVWHWLWVLGPLPVWATQRRHLVLLHHPQSVGADLTHTSSKAHLKSTAALWRNERLRAGNRTGSFSLAVIRILVAASPAPSSMLLLNSPPIRYAQCSIEAVNFEWNGPWTQGAGGSFDVAAEGPGTGGLNGHSILEPCRTVELQGVISPIVFGAP